MIETSSFFCLAEEGITLVEGLLVLLQRSEIGGTELGEHHVQVAAADGRTFLDKHQVLRGKDDTLDVAHQVAEAAGPFAIHKDGLFFAVIGRQFDLNIHSDAGFLQLHTNGCEIRTFADHLFILRCTVAAAQRAVMDGFQQVGFSRSVLAEEDIHPRVGCNFQLLIVAEVPQF